MQNSIHNNAIMHWCIGVSVFQQSALILICLYVHVSQNRLISPSTTQNTSYLSGRSVQVLQHTKACFFCIFTTNNNKYLVELSCSISPSFSSMILLSFSHTYWGSGRPSAMHSISWRFPTLSTMRPSSGLTNTTFSGSETVQFSETAIKKGTIYHLSLVTC